VLDAHLDSQSHVVAGIEGGLARDGADLALQRAKTLRIIVRVVFWEFEFPGWPARLRRDLFVLRECSRRMPALSGSSVVLART
jgi:hypothetical protein